MGRPDMKILVVEDDLLSQAILKDALERLGYSVTLKCLYRAKETGRNRVVAVQF